MPETLLFPNPTPPAGIADASAVIGSGALRGTALGKVDRYLGIPYAAAPFGEHRFALPAPIAPWEGVRDATAYGATAPQSPYTGPIGELLSTVVVPGEEILNLNVWAPVGVTAAPVMVWIHGGSLGHGANSIQAYDGTAFARDGVVLVSVNYRLGVEGFSVLDDAPTNLGLHDIVAALRWVQREIATFGGDPARVTIFGESAGATAIGALLAHPDARSLFGQAILQSGPLAAQPRQKAKRMTNLVAKHLDIPTTRAAFSAVDSADLVAALASLQEGATPISGGVGVDICIDGDLVPRHPFDALLAGAGADIPVIIGSTTEEHRLWFVPTGLSESLGRVHLLGAMLKFGVSPRTASLYRRNRPGAPFGEILGALATDLLLRIPFNRIVDARDDAPSYLYEFAWASRIDGLGACHALELGFVFDTVDGVDAHALAGPNPPQALADEMHAAWVAFATTGDPGWPTWDASRPTKVFDSPVSRVDHSLREDERVRWR